MQPSVLDLRQRIKAPRSYYRAKRLLIFVLVGIVTVTTVKLAKVFPLPLPNTRLNLILANTPAWASDYAGFVWPGHPAWGRVEDIEPLRQARWPGSFDVPRLRRPGMGSPKDHSPAYLMLHVFSTPTVESRRRRELMRSHSPIFLVPRRYKHLVDIRFVLGHLSTQEETSEDDLQAIQAEEKEIDSEQASHGDLIRLERLKHGENMNEGKTLEWLRWVGRPGSREAQWVMKCDDDTFPILPNLLSLLQGLDPAQPTYLGTALGHYAGYAYYFEGMMYGFNWGVVKSIASANMSEWHLHRHFDEDAYTGSLMYNLPSRPDLSIEEADRLRCTDPSDGQPAVPISPDPRTGLVRFDFGNRAGSFDRWWIAGPRKAVAWHNLKTDESWLAAAESAVEGSKSIGKEFMWDPPEAFEAYADTSIHR